MEIKRFYDEYKNHSPRQFYEWISQDRIMELRFLTDLNGEKFKDWDLVQQIGKKYNIDIRFSSFYVKNYDDVKHILYTKYNGKMLCEQYNIFVSVNPKRKIPQKSKSGLIYQGYHGGYAGTSHIQNIAADIETLEHNSSATEAQLQECIDGALFLIKLYNYEDYYINISGNGCHLWARLDNPIEIPLPPHIETEDKIKYNHKDPEFARYKKMYWKYIELMDIALKTFNVNLKVDDGAKDFTRILRLPGSMNVKINRTPRWVGTVLKNIKINKGLQNQMLSVKPALSEVSKKLLKTVEKSGKYRYNYLNLRDSPLYKLLVSGLLPSNVSRNHYLESSFARILRDNNINIDQVQDIISEINIVQQKTVQVDPDYLDDEEIFNPETINAYCFACKMPFIYPILEDIPEISEGNISKEHLQKLNSYSEKTYINIAINQIKPNSYLELKMLIRKLVDENIDRSTIYFTCKKLYIDDYPIYNIGEIIIGIMNKTRKRLL